MAAIDAGAGRGSEAQRAHGTRRLRLPTVAARASVLAIAAVLAMSVVVGAAAAVVGGPLSDVGAGPGGLWGVPQLALVGVAVLVAAPGAVLVLFAPVRRRLLASALLLTAPLAIAAAFFVVPHLLDPCAGGVWTLGSRAGSVPLCEPWGRGVNIAERFHLLLHGAATSVVAAPVLVALWRSTPSASDVPPAEG